MSLTKTLLAGVAACALCTAPALARTAPDVHLGGIDTSFAMKTGSAAHIKSNGVHRDATDVTETVTFTGSLSISASHKVPLLLWAETWYQPSTCTQPANETGKFPKKTKAASIKTGTSTGNISGCGSTIFTFYGPLYDLKTTMPKHGADSFTGTVSAKNFNGYNLKLVANTDLTFTAE